MKKQRARAANFYKKRVVAFIDVLGFRRMVATGKVSQIMTAMEAITRRLRLIGDIPESPLATSQFSDSLIISAPYDQDGIVHAIHFVSVVASELFLRGIWCRGAVVFGDMHHDGNVAFGPALIHAVELEGQVAIYPRILVAAELADEFLRIKNSDLPKSRRAGLAAYFRRDFDHHLHIDIFSYKMFRPPKTGTISRALTVVRRHVMNSIDATETPELMKVPAKIFWIATYLKYVDELHGAWHFTIGERGAVPSKR